MTAAAVVRGLAAGFIAAAAIAAAAAARPQEPPPELARLEAEAEARYTAGDLEAAVAIYHQLAERRPQVGGRVEALITAAWLEHRLGYDQMAEESLDRALSLDLEHPFEPANYDTAFAEVYRLALEARVAELRRQAAVEVQRGIDALESGAPGAAREALEKALAIHPKDPVALYYLGKAEVEAGELASGRERLRRVAEWESSDEVTGPSPDVRLAAISTLAELDREAGRDEAAIAGFQKVLARLRTLDPDALEPGRRVIAHSRLGFLFYRQGLFEDAERHLEAALGLDPDRAADWQVLALARQAMGRPEAAMEAFRRALSFDAGNPDLVRGLAASLRRQGDWGAVAELLSDAVAERPEAPELWLELGLARRHLGDGRGAVEALEEAVRLDEGNRAGVAAAAASRLAFLHLRDDDPARAAELASRATGWEGDDVDAWLYLCIARQRLDQPQAALESCRRAVELDPERADAWSRLGILRAERREYGAAEEAFRRALSVDPDHGAAREGLEVLRGNLTRHAEALGLLLAADGSPPGGARVASVTPRSAAAAADLEAGDIIRRADDREIASADDLLYYLATLDSPSEVELEVLRGGRSKSLRLEY